jgi:hypothetical protein
VANPDVSGPVIEASFNMQGVEYKDGTDESIDRWSEILDMALVRLFERQERVVKEKSGGPKLDKSPGIDLAFDLEVWNKQLVEDIRRRVLPVRSIVTEFAPSSIAVESEKICNMVVPRASTSCNWPVEHCKIPLVPL